MSDEQLDPAELEAIQAAIRETAPPRRATREEAEATRLTLLSDDRLAEAARPVLLALATRWVRGATRALQSYLPGAWQLDVVGAEIIDGAAAKEELRGGWAAGVHADTGAELIVAAHGGLIDLAAAFRCGAEQAIADSGRAPSAMAMRLFQPAGKALVESLNAAWREAFPTRLAPTADLALVARLIAAPTVVRAVLSFGGSVDGRIKVYARPEALVAARPALAAVSASAQLVANALSNVPVEVIVELGTLRMPLGQLRRLERGATLALPGFVDSPVPVYCGGVLKAWARPVVSRGVLAAQIERVVHDQGTKP
ncbi:MAG TPA: FliM/FliN family flagellar motor switch protein [Kofleriaceae bacterium]